MSSHPKPARRRDARVPLAYAALTGAALLAVPSARAQLLDRFLLADDGAFVAQPGVGTRLRPQLEDGGVRLGRFVVRPEVVAALGYNDNVLGADPARGSVVGRTSATLLATSDWSRHGLSAAAAVDDVRYLDEPRQSFTNWAVAAAGRYDIGRDAVRLSGSAQRLSQTPRDLDVPQFDQALAFQQNTVRLAYRATFNRLSLEPALEVLTYRYENGTALGVPYVQTYRNRNVLAPSVVANYEFAPGRSAILAVRGASANYTDRAPGSVERDFTDVSALIGLDYEATSIWRYRVLVGYQRRDFSSSQTRAISAPVVEGAAIWTPTRLTRVSGTLSRRIQDSADEADVAFTETTLRLAVDHEYRRDIFLRGNVGLAIGEYGQSGNGQNGNGQSGGLQTLTTAGVGATWLVNRNVALSLTYDFANRQSDGTANLGVNRSLNFGSSYIQNQVLLQLGFTL